ncbi:MAG TPA: hemerythrin domain-containing protein, partial [Saprospiraceae bacterium]|nr:hemerythrin domain-containing protein [Saprospiraceae bacterium]
NILFPMIKEIVNAKKSNSKLSFGKNKFSEIVMTTEEEHDHVGRAMEKIRALSDNYSIPSDACTSYKLLYKMLEEFENDLFTHIHLENNILFPKAIEIEKTLP